ncbi:Glutathione S-transferase kappa 1 [Gryganskiella cystojenkinii]|nr:Glutathione S-transferase kappa 1 [Gryganskiella cystojenkinii]
MSSPASIICYFDIVSPYSYYGVTLLNRYKALWGDKVQVEFRPTYLHGIMIGSKNQPPAVVAAKGSYMISDLKKTSAIAGIPFTFPSAFPIQTVHVMRALIVVKNQEPAKYQLAIELLYDAYWNQDKDITQKDVVVATLAPAFGGSAAKVEEILQQATDKDVKQELTKNTEEALEKGAFGAPSFVVKASGSEEEHFFFGSDRFELMSALLNLPYYGLAKNSAARL